MNRRRIASTVGVLALIGIFAAPCTWAAVHYVDDSAVAGANNGTGWADAYTNLQTAFTAAVSNDQIWVAEGTYKPTYGTVTTVRFVLKAYVSYYGGFAGTESAVSERDLTNYVSVLSGDIGTAGLDTDNSTGILSGSSAVGALVDGFTITKGYGTGTGVGLNNNLGAITVRNCIFDSNTGNQGAGVHSDNSRITFDRCIFRNNNASSRAGGLQIYHGEGSLVVNCLFYSNVCAGIGGAVNVYHARVTFEHCTMADNSAPRGVGVYTSNGGTMSATNCIFWDVNGSAGLDYGGGLSPKQPAESNQGFIDLSYCDVRGGFAAPANGTTANEITGDPLFVAAGDYHLQSGSPCINAGTTIGAVLEDLDNGVRPTGGGYDMGAYEYGSLGGATTTSTSTSTTSTSEESTSTSTTSSSTSETTTTSASTSTTSSTSTSADTTPPGPVINLTATPDASTIQLDWQNPSDADFAGVLILGRAWYPVGGAPSDGTVYTNGDAIGDAVVAYAGPASNATPGAVSAWLHGGLPPAGVFFYAVFAYDGAANYSTPVSTNAALNPGLDSDGDGMSNGDEYVAGTDPLDGGAYLLVASETCLGLVNSFVVTDEFFNVYTSDVLTVEALELGWPSTSNRLYDLYSTTNLAAEPFLPILTDMPATPPVNVITTIPDFGVHRYYQILVKPVPPPSDD